MLDIASDFYKNLFCFEEGSGFSLDIDFFSPNKKVAPEKNLNLETPSTEQEVKMAVLTLIQMGLQGQMVFLLCFTILSGS
jgi:hypothetical protein